ncbi:OX-2 membrane glycoprotein-like isoform X2 [Mugil cephalus]|uniref:OX-2 membrane glycoprotein-like isoform X2 n=1 Tax=Mugil cephalus TaxID=48193 RepID=UPI001FB5EC68|nr:OX-2 membrane glycoprotein-like isoform X2 [Mugil cephalus]
MSILRIIRIRTTAEGQWKGPRGLTAVIQTQQTVMAAVGDKASLHCQLMETKDVLQVTWQKISPRGDANVATYNKHFGERVNPGFKDKVEFEDAGLQNCSIVINNVTEQDEACYLCLFNSYPEGALTGRTCLQVYELHQPVVHVRESNSTGEVVVSCSATGRPAPTVTLRATQAGRNLTDYDSVSVSNTNGTVTVTTTAVLSALHVNSTQVGCRVGVLSGPQIEVLETIPGLKPTSADGLDDQSGSGHRDINFAWIFILFVLFVVAYGFAAFSIFRLKQRKLRSDRDFEKLDTTIKDTQRKTFIQLSPCIAADHQCCCSDRCLVQKRNSYQFDTQGASEG